jgi:hypothetical protein
MITTLANSCINVSDICFYKLFTNMFSYNSIYLSDTDSYTHLSFQVYFVPQVLENHFLSTTFTNSFDNCFVRYHYFDGLDIHLHKNNSRIGVYFINQHNFLLWFYKFIFGINQNKTSTRCNLCSSLK